MSVVHGFGQRLRQVLADSNQLAQAVGLGSAPIVQPTSGRAQVIAVAAQKGGVGKTTTAVHLAAGLAMYHHLQVLLIDLDNQGHVASSLRSHLRARASQTVSSTLMQPEPDLAAAVLPTQIPGLSITSADKQLGQTEAMLAARIGRELLLQRALRNVRGQFDVIVLDCPPNLGLLTLNALSAADHVLIPCDLSVLALEGVDDLLRTLDQLQWSLGRSPNLLGLLHTRVDKRNQKQNAAIRRAVADKYAGLPLHSEIAVNTAISGAQLNGACVFADAPESAGARDYTALAAEIFGRLRK